MSSNNQNNSEDRSERFADETTEHLNLVPETVSSFMEPEMMASLINLVLQHSSQTDVQDFLLNFPERIRNLCRVFDAPVFTMPPGFVRPADPLHPEYISLIPPETLAHMRSTYPFLPDSEIMEEALDALSMGDMPVMITLPGYNKPFTFPPTPELMGDIRYKYPFLSDSEILEQYLNAVGKLQIIKNDLDYRTNRSVESQWRRDFRTNPSPPFGIACISSEDMISMEEVIVLSEQGKWSGTLTRVDRFDHYTSSGPYVRLIMAISADYRCLRSCWSMITTGRGPLTIPDFFHVMDFTSNWLYTNHPSRRFVFIFDPLLAVNHDAIQRLLEPRGHRMIYRPPNSDGDSPIQQYFEEMNDGIYSSLVTSSSAVDVSRTLKQAIESVEDFFPYFHQCGYVPIREFGDMHVPVC